MKAWMLRVTLLLVVGTLGCEAKPKPVREKKVPDEAVAEIEKLGGSFLSSQLQVRLVNTPVTDADLERLAKDLTHVRSLILDGTQVTDAGLLKLKTLPKLKKLYLWNSKATPEGAAALKKELPELEAFFGAN